MINLPAKPTGSTIEVSNEANRTILSWKNAQSGLGRYGVLVFLLAWMGGWGFGWYAAFTQVSTGKGGGFLIFWLIAWTAGGIFAAATIFKLVQPERPERLILDTLNLVHKPGTARMPAFNFNARRRMTNPIELLRLRKTIKAPKGEIGEIRLERVGERQRLTFDYGTKRIEVGEYLEEPEREWLMLVLKSWKSS